MFQAGKVQPGGSRLPHKDLPVQVQPHLAGEARQQLLFLLFVLPLFREGCSVEPPKDTSLGDLMMPKGVTFHTRNAFFLWKIPAWL